MYRLFKNLLAQAIFWLIFFNIPRICFLIYHINLIRIDNIPFREVIAIFPNAFKLDISTACYFLVIPFFLIVIQAIKNSRITSTIMLVYNGIILFLYTLLSMSEIGVYAEWKTKIDYRALYYLRRPGEIAASSSTWEFIVLLLMLLLIFISFFMLFRRYILPTFRKIKANWKETLIFGLITPVLLFTGLRGGFSEVPVNQSECYYSKHNILNLVAVNPAYSLIYSFYASREFENSNPFVFYPMAEAKRTVDSLYSVEKDTTAFFLKTDRPNIVMIIIESWSADVIESLGGEPGITPRFHELEKDGLLFTDFYSAGNRSQQGMASIFGGFPAIPVTAITHHNNKFIKLPSLTKRINAVGYNSSFYFGGQLIYGGLRAYMMFNEFDRIVEQKDFESSIPSGKLGIHDQYLFDRHLKDMHEAKQPFFTAMFTLSSHSPYDQPMKQVLSTGGNEKPYVNSVYYTDSCIGDYLQRAKKESWYKNTLFILVADHSHNTFRNWPVNSPPYRRIPLLMYGDVIKDEYKGKKIERISSHTDIPKTLLKQLNLNSDGFHWSRDMMNPYSKEFAFWEINIGCGWINKDGYYIYQNNDKSFEENTFTGPARDKAIKDGKSFLEVLFQEFTDF